MDLNIIINGDSLKELKKIESNSIDLIFADPPYWMRVDGVLRRTSGVVYDGCNDEWDQFNSLEEYESFETKWLHMGYWKHAMYLYNWCYYA